METLTTMEQLKAKLLERNPLQDLIDSKVNTMLFIQSKETFIEYYDIAKNYGANQSIITQCIFGIHLYVKTFTNFDYDNLTNKFNIWNDMNFMVTIDLKALIFPSPISTENLFNTIVKQIFLEIFRNFVKSYVATVNQKSITKDR